MIKFLDLKHQYEMIKPEIDHAILSVIHESAFIGGKYVKKFEANFAAYQQVRHCIGVANGTDALEIALESLSLPHGSEVLVPSNSFIATSEAVTRAGHRVVFCDCCPENYTISVEDAERRITPRTKAVIVVHTYGHPCDMDRIRDLAERYSLKVIEDCAQAHGAEYKGRRVGGICDIGTFSFYPGKNLGAYGDGGAITTDDSLLAERCRMIANHGRKDKYDHQFEGRNSRLDGIQAAILDVKLRYLENWIEHRRQLAEIYRCGLSGIDGLTPPEHAVWGRHVWHLYVVRTPQRDALRNALEASGIQTGVHYPIALPKLVAYAYLGQGEEKMFSADADSQLLSLPIGEHLSHVDVDAVTECVLEFFRK